jgi:hypothetical protein
MTLKQPSISIEKVLIPDFGKVPNVYKFNTYHMIFVVRLNCCREVGRFFAFNNTQLKKWNVFQKKGKHDV